MGSVCGVYIVWVYVEYVVYVVWRWEVYVWCGVGL